MIKQDKKIKTLIHYENHKNLRKYEIILKHCLWKR